MRQVERRSVDLSGFPGLVVVILGLRVTAWRGIATMLGLGRGIAGSVAHRPDGLLVHEGLMFGWRHIGMRQYWRDLDSLDAYTKSDPHRTWWRDFLRDNRGTGVWHEVYSLAGGMEGIYSDLPGPVGFGRFAPSRPPDGKFTSFRGRLRQAA